MQQPQKRRGISLSLTPNKSQVSQSRYDSPGTSIRTASWNRPEDRSLEKKYIKVYSKINNDVNAAAESRFTNGNAGSHSNSSDIWAINPTPSNNISGVLNQNYLNSWQNHLDQHQYPLPGN